MKNNNNSKSFLFLTEMCIAILFLAITCAVSIQMYAKAKSINNQSKDLSSSVNICENVASLIKSGESREQLAKTLGGTKKEDGSVYIYYDNHWNTTKENPNFIAKIEFQEHDILLDATIVIEKVNLNTNEQVYALSVSQFIG